MIATTADLSDAYPQAHIADSIFRDFGGVPMFYGPVTTLKVFAVNASLPTKNTRHILIGKYSPEKPAEKRVIADFFRRNASFEHSSNKQQFLLFESHISPAFSKTNPEYFKRKTGSQYPCRRNRIGGTPIFTFPLPVRQK